MSPNVAPNPNDQSRSNSISRVPLQISPFRSFFHFRLTVKIKGSSHKKKLNISIFSRMISNGFNKTLWVYITFETQQQDTIDFSRENP